MDTTTNNEYIDAHSNRFHRSLSPCSFERFRYKHSDYFYKPKRGPSISKSNITITRPIKAIETVTNLVEYLSKGNNFIKRQSIENTDLSLSYYSSLLSMDETDSSSITTFSSRSNSSLLTSPEQESQMTITNEQSTSLCLKDDTNVIIQDKKPNYFLSSCEIPAIGINITTTDIHLVLLELYPQNVDYSTIVFQRYLISLITNYEHNDWSISNIELQTQIEQEANFRLFTLKHEEFDEILQQLQTFINLNSSLASSFVLNLSLTGEQTNIYERKISLYLNKINLNFDIIQSRAESYMIGLDFFINNYQNELVEILNNHIIKTNKYQLYPYILIHIEITTSIFYIVHSSNKYSVLISNNLCYKTYLNLINLLQPGFNAKSDEQISSSFIFRRPPPLSLDCTRQDLYENGHQSTLYLPSQVPLTSFTRIPQRYFPSDYSTSKTSHYIYRGWSNQRTSSNDKNLVTYDVHTQTDDSFLELSSLQTRLAMHRSLLSMFTMNMALTTKVLFKLYPSIHHCILTGEFFQIEKQATQDFALYIRSIMGQNTPYIYQLKRESLISAIGCALPRIYFDIVDEEKILENDFLDL